jgi:hypothetical protein
MLYLLELAHALCAPHKERRATQLQSLTSHTLQALEVPAPRFEVIAQENVVININQNDANTGRCYGCKYDANSHQKRDMATKSRMKCLGCARFVCGNKEHRARNLPKMVICHDCDGKVLSLQL